MIVVNQEVFRAAERVLGREAGESDGESDGLVAVVDWQLAVDYGLIEYDMGEGGYYLTPTEKFLEWQSVLALEELKEAFLSFREQLRLWMSKGGVDPEIVDLSNPDEGDRLEVALWNNVVQSGVLIQELLNGGGGG